MTFPRIVRIVIACAIIALAPFLPPFSGHLMTMGVGMHLLMPEKKSLLERWTSAPITSTYDVNNDTDAPLPVDVYVPLDGKSDRTAIILYSPVVADPRRDERLTRIADAFARIGFVVAIPGRPEILSPFDDGEAVRLRRLTHFLLDTPSLHVGKAGMFGVCYGNGATFAAAADPETASSISFLIAFASHYDMQSALSFLLQGGEYEYGDVSGKGDPHIDAKMLAEIPLRQAGMSPTDFGSDARFLAARQRLSPMTSAPSLSTHVYLLHAKDDPYVPFTESMRLHDALRKAGGNPSLLLTSALTHNGFRPATADTIRTSSVEDGIQAYLLLHRFITEEI